MSFRQEDTEQRVKNGEVYSVDFDPSDAIGRFISLTEITNLGIVFPSHQITKSETPNRTTLTFQTV